MRINVDLDDEMLAKLMKLGNYKTKRAAVDASLDYFLLYMERNPDAKFEKFVKSKKN